MGVYLPILETLTAALSGIKTLKEIVSGLSNKEVRNELNEKIADLLDVILSARIQMAEMQDKYEQILKENKELKEATAPREKTTLKWGCYQFEGDDGMYCTACYDSKGKKIRASRVLGHYICNVCKAHLS